MTLIPWCLRTEKPCSHRVSTDNSRLRSSLHIWDWGLHSAHFADTDSSLKELICRYPSILSHVRPPLISSYSQMLTLLSHRISADAASVLLVQFSHFNMCLGPSADTQFRFWQVTWRYLSLEVFRSYISLYLQLHLRSSVTLRDAYLGPISRSISGYLWIHITTTADKSSDSVIDTFHTVIIISPMYFLVSADRLASSCLCLLPNFLNSLSHVCRHLAIVSLPWYVGFPFNNRQ